MDEDERSLGLLPERVRPDGRDTGIDRRDGELELPVPTLAGMSAVDAYGPFVPHPGAGLRSTTGPGVPASTGRGWARAGTVGAVASGAALWRDASRPPQDMVLASTDHVTGAISDASATGFWTIAILCMATFVCVGLVRRWRDVAAAAVADKNAQVAATHQLRGRTSRQEERELVAREVHDTVAHHLSLISPPASVLEVDRDAGGPEVRAVAQQMLSSAQRAINEMRGLLTTPRTGPTTTRCPEPRWRTSPVCWTTCAGTDDG